MTPLYKRLKSNGTTFYAFPGAAEDISAAYQNQNYKMYFSKYVLLNFPKQNLVEGSGVNRSPKYWDFESTFQRSNFSTPPQNYSDGLVESLRNYVANHEVTMKDSKINNREYYYDNTELNTPTEKIFWKWCKKMNLIDFEPASNGDEYFGNLQEFERGSLTDDEYFSEILWKERETTEWETTKFRESGKVGFTNKLEIVFEGTTNFRIGDLIEINNLSNSTLISTFGTASGYRVKVDSITDPTSLEGQTIVTDFTYNDSEITDSAKCKLVYQRLVQYIGEVNGINNVNEANRSYTEVYAHIPDHTGRTPDILFRTMVDENYKPNLTFPILPSEIQPEIKGAAINGSIDFNNPIVRNPIDYPGNYYGQFDTEDFTYDTSLGDSFRRSGDYYGISGTIESPVVDGSTIDGISIDFDPNHYVKMNLNGREITNFEQFNALLVNNQPPQDFDFNAILWYYTVEDINGNKKSNLYGISILDNPDNNPILNEKSLRIPQFKKLAANDTQDGTSYAFSLNLSFNIINENPQDAYNPEAINSLFSMNLFNESMKKLSSVNESFLQIVANQNNLDQEISNMKQLLYTQTDLNLINTKINSLESLLRLYSQNQIAESETIGVSLDQTSRPPRITLTNKETSYTQINTIFTQDMYNVDGVIPQVISVPTNKNFLVKITNNDINNFNLPNEERLILQIQRDLSFKQSMDLVIDATDESTQNKKLDVVFNFRFGPSTNTPVETNIITNIDLPVYYNTFTKTTNSSKNWQKNNFLIDLSKTILLNTGGILEIPLSESPNLVNNSFKQGDIIKIKDFSIGTLSTIDFSGQYRINSVGLTNSYIYLDVNNNQNLINYGASASLPFTFNDTQNYLLNNKPYLDLNKGEKWRITRISESETSSIQERYLIEKLL